MKTQGLSPQRRYQLRHRAFGLCHECARPARDGWRCALHQEKNRARQRRYARLRRLAQRRRAARRRTAARRRGAFGRRRGAFGRRRRA